MLRRDAALGELRQEINTLKAEAAFRTWRVVIQIRRMTRHPTTDNEHHERITSAQLEDTLTAKLDEWLCGVAERLSAAIPSENAQAIRKGYCHACVAGVRSTLMRIVEQAFLKEPVQRFVEGAVRVRIATLLGEAWQELTVQPLQNVASILLMCPQPPRRWPGDEAVNYRLVFGTQLLQDEDIVGELLLKHRTGAEDDLKLTLCVHGPQRRCLKVTNKRLPKPQSLLLRNG